MKSVLEGGLARAGERGPGPLAEAAGCRLVRADVAQSTSSARRKRTAHGGKPTGSLLVPKLLPSQPHYRRFF